MNNCKKCRGEGYIYRPEYPVTEVYPPVRFNGVPYEETRMIGGIDACPDCAAFSEIVFKEEVEAA